MVSNALEIILNDLSKSTVLRFMNLVPDRNNTCLIQMPNGIKLQIELDSGEKNLLVGSDLGEVPKSNYRLDLFRQALRANNAPYPRFGTFAFSTKTEHLILFDLLHLDELNGEQLGEYLIPFLEKAAVWSKALINQEVPQTNFAPSKGVGGLFGLIK